MLLVMGAMIIAAQAQVNQIVGKWQTIDDNDGSKKSIVNIFKASNGKYYGKIEHLFKDPEKLCTECDGQLKNKPVMGMTIINNMVVKKNELTGGTILDPKNGKVYHCTISYDKETGKLSVRGSLDSFGLLGRSQTWVKTEN